MAHSWRRKQQNNRRRYSRWFGHSQCCRRTLIIRIFNNQAVVDTCITKNKESDSTERAVVIKKHHPQARPRADKHVRGISKQNNVAALTVGDVEELYHQQQQNPPSGEHASAARNEHFSRQPVGGVSSASEGSKSRKSTTIANSRTKSNRSLSGMQDFQRRGPRIRSVR